MRKTLGLILFLCGLAWQTRAQMVPFAFWKARNVFTWIAGSNIQTTSGFYGTLGTGSISNTPGERGQSTSWIDSAGNLWLFGGYGFDSVGANSILSDLWKYTPSNGQWTWVSGPATVGVKGTYGTQGAGSASNAPGARAKAASWVDAAGNFWIFGGNGTDANGNWLYLNDLWKFNPSNNQWTWVSGAQYGYQSGIYGTLGTGSTNQFPGSRYSPVTWLDASGNLWLFGGYGVDGTGNEGELNDLWKFNPSNSQWTWVSGAATRNGLGVYGALGTGSTANFPGARYASSGWIDGSGNFWLLGGIGVDNLGATGFLNDLWEFTPGTLAWTWVSGSKNCNGGATYGTKGSGSTSNSPGARLGHSTVKDSSGLFWLFGGFGLDFNGSAADLSDVWKFDPGTKTWTWMSGSQFISQAGAYGSKGIGSSSNGPGSRETAVMWADSSANLWIFGGFGIDGGNHLTYENDLWKYTPASGNWAWMTGPSINLEAPVFGTLGTGSPSTYPGARNSAAGWTDISGNLWMFGGASVDEYGNLSYGNDFWKYNPSTQIWTWIAGSADHGALGTYGTKGTGGTTNIPGARSGSMMSADASGTFWLFGGTGTASAGYAGFLSDLWKYNVSSGQWTWVSGPNTVNQAPAYGTKGIPSTSNIPGSRDGGVSWIDSSGNIWIFGGLADDVNGQWDYANDLWMFNPTNGQWTWMTGSSTRNQSGTYGTLGTGATGNTPGARNHPLAWTDSSGNFWLFGGLGYDSSGTLGFLNDLWKYTPSTSQWAWVSGSNAVNQNGSYGTLGVAAGTNVPGGREMSALWIDGSGNLWLLGGYGLDKNGALDSLNDVWKFIPSTGLWTWIGGSNVVNQVGSFGTLNIPALSNIPGARSKSVTWTDRKGKAWIFGGTSYDSVHSFGSTNDFWKFSF
jgi:N-acetylneuraminic acid mutarotase